MLAAGLLAKKAAEKGLKVKPWVKTSLAPGSQVVSDYYAAAGLAGISRQARLQPRRLWLHHLHRQFRAACPSRSPRRSRTAISRSPRCSPATAISRAASMRWCGRTTSPRRRWSSPTRWPARCASTSRPTRSAKAATASRSICATSGRATRRSPTRCAARCSASSFQQRYGNVFEGPPEWRAVTGAGGMTYDFQDASTYLALPPYFENMPKEPGPVQRRRRRARAGDLRRQHHHRPHLARRQHQGREPGRRVPDQLSGAADRLQHLRRAARQPQRDDARHLRQYPHQERDGAGGRGRHDQAAARRHGDADLRRGDGIQEARRAAGDLRRQGIRHRLVARLGGQGHAAARGQGGDRRELRAHPPLEPGRDGRAAAAVQGRHDPPDPRS